jgi:hypothetical protein
MMVLEDVFNLLHESSGNIIAADFSKFPEEFFLARG